MTSFTTLISGDKFFPYKDHLNAVHPDHADAQFFIPKLNSHTSISSWHKNFWKSEEIEDNYPYTLGEDALRLYQIARFEELSEDLQFEALIFNFHKVYPPGDRPSPEVSDRGLVDFDEKFVQKIRRIIKRNSLMVREAFGISKNISSDLLDFHKELQSNMLYFLQHKSDEELQLMNLPEHTEPLVLLSDSGELLLDGSTCDTLIPTDENLVRKCWWREFKKLKGAERFEKFGLDKYNEIISKHRRPENKE